MLIRPLIALLGIDPDLLRRCPLRERWRAYVVGLVALVNCVALGASIEVSLEQLGEAPIVSVVIGSACGVWFSVIQRLLVILHGYRRSGRRSLVSRAFCVCFLLLFGLVAAYGTGECWEKWYGVTLWMGEWYGVTSTRIWYGVTFCSFLLPFGIAPRVLAGGVYGDQRLAQECAILEVWRVTFMLRYEGFVRQHFGLSTYQMPKGMVRYDSETPAPLQLPSFMG